LIEFVAERGVSSHYETLPRPAAAQPRAFTAVKNTGAMPPSFRNR
jgi:hypothetical protein